MQNGKSEDVIRIRVLPEEATEVAEWAGLMLSELVEDESAGNGEPVRLRDPERAAELLELLVLCAEEGADASAALEPAMKLREAARERNEGLEAARLPDSNDSARPEAAAVGCTRMRGAGRFAAAESERFAAGYPSDWHPYYGSGTEDFSENEDIPAYRSGEERDEVLMAVRFGASALIDLARSHGMRVPDRKMPGEGRPHPPRFIP
ncbi:hypothetical protein [Saccharibacillus alkalitolerans]|uniref:Uncharacterized protein n=1 Tax=Saccharibacillus alkalitolerans TaxID=2705290 RepID=A0ABX0F8R0_9BACL|nr:hypothetical protein [Saccharibacillus alkalitolerans]NGZ76359.1 hypothetical protein [Saccharibacillus alkalitolerans]